MTPPYKVLTALVTFLIAVSFSVTGIAGMTASRRYLQYESGVIDHIAARSIYLTFNYAGETPRRLTAEDAASIRQLTAQECRAGAAVVPVYSFSGGVYPSSYRVIGIDSGNAAYFGLEELADDTAYFTASPGESVSLRIAVTTVEANGYSSDRMETVTLRASGGAAENSLLAAVREKCFPLTRKEDTFLLVNLSTFRLLASVMFQHEYASEAALSEGAGEYLCKGLFVCSEKLNDVGPLTAALTEACYNAQPMKSAFVNYEERLSLTFTAFSLASAALVLLTAVDLFLAAKAAGQLNAGRPRRRAAAEP